MDGFIPGSRATFMLDAVALVMIGIVPILWWSVLGLARRRHYGSHAKVQMTMACALLLALIFFEIEIRLVGWRERAAESPFLGPVLFSILGIHIAIAVGTLTMWFLTIRNALKNFSWPPQPNAHSSKHRMFGMYSVLGMTLTALSGWIFYWMAFFAKT